jgi:hypothetical protein
MCVVPFLVTKRPEFHMKIIYFNSMEELRHLKVAVLHQATPPPLDESGIPKPMKPGGYKDSGKRHFLKDLRQCRC